MASPLTVKRNPYIKNPKRRDIPTPKVIAEFIASLFPGVRKVFDPCVGDGALLAPFQGRGIKVSGVDLKQGIDFLQMTEHIEADLVVCNPPFNLGVGRRLGSEIFLEKIVELGGPDIPIVLFAPMGFRLNQRKRSKRWRWLRDKMPPITSILSLPLDIFEDVEFHSEVLFFNCRYLEAHYWLPLDF